MCYKLFILTSRILWFGEACNWWWHYLSWNDNIMVFICVFPIISMGLPTILGSFSMRISSTWISIYSAINNVPRYMFFDMKRVYGLCSLKCINRKHTFHVKFLFGYIIHCRWIIHASMKVGISLQETSLHVVSYGGSIYNLTMISFDHSTPFKVFVFTDNVKSHYWHET